MQLSLLKCKIHRATVISCDLDYEGSISIDADFMEKAGLLPFEQVDVLNIDNGERLTTYVISAPKGSGMIGLNGAAARKAMKGDKIIIVAYGLMDQNEAMNHKPTVLLMDSGNKISKII
jgi:aspartate 1-decarboxylase